MTHQEGQKHMAAAKLTLAEKAEIRQSLFDRMQTGEMQQTLPSRFFWSPLRFAYVGLFGLIVTGSGVSYAAEGALPGDALYPVKVEITERLRTWSAVSYEAQAEWSVTRTTRRLEELERLASAGDLNDTLREKITNRLEQNTEEANKAIVSLKKERITAAADTSSRLESSLRVHERMLVQVAQERADISSQIHVILDMVRKKADSISEIREEIENEISQDEQIEVIPAFTEEEIGTSTAEITEEEEADVAEAQDPEE
ncbi:MAG: Uncharacterized protein G01um101470_225 [Parcubacteria group bacterium Gr01-1014_70]|nr:MAG: Uncharacterized protein G01um101470_225 [Parcubacteria group bacterium Gr01-1014_70]